MFISGTENFTITHSRRPKVFETKKERILLPSALAVHRNVFLVRRMGYKKREEIGWW